MVAIPDFRPADVFEQRGLSAILRSGGTQNLDAALTLGNYPVYNQNSMYRHNVWAHAGFVAPADWAPVFQAANAAAVADGTKVVYVPFGTYEMSTNWTPSSGVAVIGDGATLEQTDITKACVLVGGTTGVTLKGLTLTHEAGGTYDTSGASPVVYGGSVATDFKMFDCVVRDTNKQGISLANALRPVFERVQIFRTGRAGLLLTSATRPRINGIYIEDTGDDAIALNDLTTDPVVTNFHIVNAGALLEQGAGIKMHHTGAVIGNGLIKNPFSSGISIKQNNSATSTPKDATVSNVTVDGITDAASGSPTQVGIELANLQGLVRLNDVTVKAYSGTKNYRGLYVAGGNSQLVKVTGGSVFEHNSAFSGVTMFDISCPSTATANRAIFDDVEVYGALGAIWALLPNASFTGSELHINNCKVWSAGAVDMIAVTEAAKYLVIRDLHAPNWTGFIIDAFNKAHNTLIWQNVTTSSTSLLDRVSSVVNYRVSPRQASGNVAPTTGTWRAGDIVWDTSPTVGAPIGWMCTVAGTPGTWVALANL